MCIQPQITFPKKYELDVDPQVVGSRITWLRKKGRELKGDVWVKDALNDKEQVWLKNVDNAPVFFSQK